MRLRPLVALLAIVPSIAWADYYPPQTQTTTPAVGSPGTSSTAPIIENDDERAAFKGGREYVFAVVNTANLAVVGLQVPASSYLNARICNTSTTRTWYIAQNGRYFDTSSASVTPYGGIPNPDALSTSSPVTASTIYTTTGTNLLGNGATQSDITMTYGVGTSIMTVGGAAPTISGVGGIYPNIKSSIDHPRGLPPGKCFGQYAVGQSTQSGLTTTTPIYLAIRLYLYYDQ